MRIALIWRPIMAVAVCVLATGTASSTAVASASPAGSPSQVAAWGTAQPAPSLGTGAQEQFSAISCPAPGDCTAAGIYDHVNSPIPQPFVIDERNGTWGTPEPVPGLAALNIGDYATVNGISCDAPGDCAVIGSDQPASPWQNVSTPFVVSEAGGIWGSAQPLGGIGTWLDSVSCGGPGDCVAGGADGRAAVIFEEAQGTWGLQQEVPAGGASGNQVFSVSCPAPGNCVAGGGLSLSYLGASKYGIPFVYEEANGTWGAIRDLGDGSTPASGGEVDTVSCSSPGDCSLAGQTTYSEATTSAPAVYPKVFVAAETGGTWGSTAFLPGLDALNAGHAITLSNLSCASPGNCGIGGGYTDSTAPGEGTQAFVANEVDGTWQAAEEVPGTAAINHAAGSVIYGAKVQSVSCSAPGYCSAGGYYSTSPRPQVVALHPFVVDEAGGTWGSVATIPSAEALGGAQVAALACASPGSCAAVGGATVPTNTAFTVWKYTGQATSTGLRLSSASVAYGNEQGERITATVSVGAGTPTGTVLVASNTGYGNAATCVITLGPATTGTADGSCVLPAAGFKAGHWTLTGYYSGTSSLAASQSSALLTVSKSPTSTRLSVGIAKLRYGAEQAEVFAVTVTPRYARALQGTATVYAGRTAICVVKIGASGKGTCRPGQLQLKVGTYTVQAVYGSDANYTASSSAKYSLTVTR